VIILRYDRGTLLLDGVPEDQMPLGFRWDDRVQRPRAHGLHYRDTVLGYHAASADYRDDARQWPVLQLEHQTQKTARGYQTEAVDSWRAAGRKGVVTLPTGTGKSFVAELCIADAQRPTLVVAPTIDLVNQWVAVLSSAFGIEVGMLGGGSHEVRDITVSTYDSAYLHADRYGDRFGLVIFDEVHHLPSEAYAQAAEMCLAPFRLGLSATPERADGLHQELERLIGPFCFERGIQDMRGEFLADYEVRRFEVELTPDEADRYLEARAAYRDFLRGRRIFMGGKNGWGRFLREASRSTAGRAALSGHREARRIVHQASAKLDALDEILQKHADGRVIVFTNDNATVYRICRTFLVPCITHQTDAKERRAILEGFQDGTYRVVATSRVLNEGVDLPAADVGVVLSGTSTVREHVQRLGRILRPGQDKQAVLYEVITLDTTEEAASERRREHDAYR